MGNNRALTLRLGSGGPRIHSGRHGALRIVDLKKILRSSCRATNAHNRPPPYPARKTSASVQILKATEIENRDTARRRIRKKNLKAKYKRRNNKARMHQSILGVHAWEKLNNNNNNG